MAQITGEKRKSSEISITIPITIEKVQSLLDGTILLEYMPKKRIQALLKSDKLALEWENPSYCQQYAKQNHLNEIEQLKAYLKNYKENYCATVCKYIKPKHKWGRVHPVKSIGLISLGKKIRNTLIKDLYYDFDLENAQVYIIQNICLQNNIQCAMVKDYCKRRDDILKEISDEYSVKQKFAKKLILRLCFWGTFKGWCHEVKISDVEPNQWLNNFIRELREIADEFKAKNTSLYESARRLKEVKKKSKNVTGSFFALYLQEWELRIVEKIINWLMSNTDTMKHPNGRTMYHVGNYEYDGIKLLKENVDKYDGGKEGLRVKMNEKTKELTGFDLNWMEKPIDKFHDITAELELVKEDMKEDTALQTVCKEIERRMDDTGVIETIAEILPNHFVYCHKNWYGWNGEKWLPNKIPLEMAIMYKLPKHWKDKLEPFKQKYPEPPGEHRNASQKLLYGTPGKYGIKGIIGKVENFTKYHLRSNHHISGCVGRGKTLLANDDIEFDNNPDLLAWNNGVYDINEELFRPPRFNDYVTWSCGWNFSPILKGIKYLKDGNICEITQDVSGDDLKCMNEIETVLKQIFPYNDVRELVLFVLSSGLSGRAIEKFFIFNGNGRNGKGLIDEFMLWCLGDYAVTITPTVLTENKRFQSSAGPNPEKAKLNKKRFVIASEPAKNTPINNDTMKDLTGGGETQARMLQSSNTRVLLHLTFVMECNSKPALKESPEQADFERIVDILFPSLFTADKKQWNNEKHIYPKNPLLKGTQWKDDHKNMFMNMLILRLLKLKNAEYNIERYIPKNVIKRGEMYLQDSFNIHNIFTSLFEKRSDDPSVIGQYINSKGQVSDADWTLATIVKHLRRSGQFKRLTRRMQNSPEMRAESMKKFFETNSVYKSDVYTNSSTKQRLLRGWRLKVEEADSVRSNSEYQYGL